MREGEEERFEVFPCGEGVGGGGEGCYSFSIVIKTCNNNTE